MKTFGDPNDDQLYNQIEDFFSTPGPSLEGIAASKSNVNLPQLQKDRSDMHKPRSVQPNRPKAKKATSRPAGGIGKSSSKSRLGMKKSPSGQIDMTLLAEAMSYADSLGSLMANVEDTNAQHKEAGKSSKAKQKAMRESRAREQESDWNDGASSRDSGNGGRKPPSSADQQLGKSRSKPTVGRLRVSRSAGAKAEREANYGGGSAALEVRRQRGSKKGAKKGTAQKKKKAREGGFDNGSGSAAAKARSTMDDNLFDDLLKNFQNGLGLQKLKQELEQSKASMNKSRDVIFKEMGDQYHSGQ